MATREERERNEKKIYRYVCIRSYKKVKENMTRREKNNILVCFLLDYDDARNGRIVSKYYKTEREVKQNGAIETRTKYK